MTRRRGRAQAIVEFALVAPIFFVIFFGIFEVGRLMAVWISLTQGAAEAARVGAIATKSQGQIIGAAQNQTALIGAGLSDCSGNSISSNNCTTSLPRGGIVVSCSQNTSGSTSGCTRKSNEYIRVEITYPYQPVPIVYPFGAIQLSSWAQSRVE
jgi:Flp pilus assembly protein TadG